MDFPVMIFTKGGVYTICHTQEDYDILIPFWSKEPVDGASTLLHCEIAKRMIRDVKTKVKEEVTEESMDYKKLSWHKLRAYGKELEKEYGVELPLRAKRDTVEKAIQEVLDGNNKRPS